MTAPRWNTGDDSAYSAWKARRRSSVATPDEDEFQSWKAARQPKAPEPENPIISTGRTMLADVAATVPRVLSAAAREGTPGRKWLSEKADAIEEWGAPRGAVGVGTKLLTGIGKYVVLGPAALAVGGMEAAADPRFSQTALVAELEKIQRPGLAGDAARAIGGVARRVGETPLGRAIGDAVIGEVGSQAIRLGARGVGAAGRATGRTLDRALSPVPDDVVQAAFRDPPPRSGRLTPERFDEFANEVVQPPRNGVYSSRPQRITDPSRLLPERSDAVERFIDREVAPRQRLLPSRTGGAWAMTGETPGSLGEATRRAEREARERALTNNPMRDAMLSRAERTAAAPPSSDEVLRGVADRERGTDDLFRLEGGARTPAGARRLVGRVRTDDLINELVDIDAKRVTASERAQYAWNLDDDMHSTGTVVASADRRSADGVSRQAKAMQNLDDFSRMTDEIVDELKARGLAEDEIYRRFGDVQEARTPESVKAERARRAQLSAGGPDPVAAREREAMAGVEPEYMAGDGEGFELFSVGSGPGLARSARAVARSPIASSVAGGIVGANIDKDDPTRGALVGAALAGGASYIAKRAARAGAPLRLTGDADVDQVLGTIARGERTPAKADGMLSTAQKAYTKIVDGLYPLRSFGRSVGASERLSDVATQASGWQSSAAQFARDELQPILHATKGRREEVMALAKAQRAIALLDQGLEKTDIPRDVLDRTVQKLSADPDVAKGAASLQDYYRYLLDYKRANGVLSQDAFDAIEASGDYYTPFVREFEDASTRATTAGGGRFVNRGTGVRKMDDQIARAKTVDPFEQAVLDTYEAHRTVAKQRVSNVLAETVEAHDIAAHPFIRRVENQQAGKQGRVVAANLGGERRYYEVTDDDLYNAWASFDPQQQNILVTLTAPFKRALQTGVTLLPDFAVANGLRDNVMTALQYPLRARSSLGGAAVGAGVGAATSDDPVKGAAIGAGLGLGVGGLMPNVLRSMSAMRSIVKDDAIYRQWLRDGGGGFGGFYPRDAGGARKLMRELERNSVQASDVINPKRWVDALHYIGQVVEQSPRLAAYKDALATGADAAGAVAKSADISLDFSKIGTHTKGIAATTAFWNAKVQGWDKLARLLKSPKTWAQGAAMITAPSVALWAVNKDNPEYWQRPQWERNLFWLIPKDGGGFWRMPKPFEVGYLFASIPERILDYAHEKDPEALAVAMRDMLSTAADGSVPLLPTAAQPLVENTANYSFFRNRPIVSRPDLLPERQFDDRTSSLAVGVGKVAGVSPQKVDNLIAGYTGSAGKIALDVTDRVARATGLDDRPLPPDRADVPIVGDMGRRFTTKDAGSSDAVALFYRKWDRAEQAYRSVRDMVNDGESSESLRSFIRAHADDLRSYEALKETHTALQEVGKAERTILADRSLSADTKRRQQRKLRALRDQFAQGVARGDATFAADGAAPPR